MSRDAQKGVCLWRSEVSLLCGVQLQTVNGSVWPSWGRGSLVAVQTSL